MRWLWLIALVCIGGAAHADDALWPTLRDGGYALVIRHAMAPGTGDPANFRLDDCATQRNLSADGRAQATRLGETLRTQRVPVGRVLSSRWCRALETARLAFGRVEGEPALDQLGRPEERDEPTAAVRALIASSLQSGTNLVLITHQPNITTLANLLVDEGEIVVMGLAPDHSLAVYGRTKP
jgi:phosphohistidine phosphatase SixA